MYQLDHLWEQIKLAARVVGSAQDGEEPYPEYDCRAYLVVFDSFAAYLREKGLGGARVNGMGGRSISSRELGLYGSSESNLAGILAAADVLRANRITAEVRVFYSMKRRTT